MTLSPQASEKMEQQRFRYLQSLPEKKTRIEKAWSAAKKQNWSHDSFDHFRTQVHRLAGSAGSYGLDKLGQAAKCLDHLLGTIPPNEPPAERAEALARELLLRLEEAINATRS